MALPHRGRRRFAPTTIFPMLQTLFEAILPDAQNFLMRKMALPLCGRRRFAPTGIFPMLQTLFEAILSRRRFLGNEIFLQKLCLWAKLG
jgi:hypothetical protein